MLEHLPIVRFLARRIHERLPQHVDIEDLVSAGVVGLMDAFSKFDPGKKVQFRSYAQFRIRGAILDSLQNAGLESARAAPEGPRGGRGYPGVDGQDGACAGRGRGGRTRWRWSWRSTSNCWAI